MSRFFGRQISQRLTALILSLSAITLAAPAFALITGGDGNAPINDPGWPAGAAVVFNQPGRIAYWEGPPFGGGEWHSECRGDIRLFNEALANFANIDAKTKRLVVHDGIGHSFWLNMNNEPLKMAAAQMDWSFTVWQPANWQRIAKMPPALKPGNMGDAKTGPPAQIDVYTGGQIKWADVVVPKGIEVVDDRLSAHGVTPADGVVLEGTITDLTTKKPLAGRVEVQLVEPQKKGGYKYTTLAQATADEHGKWQIKHAPAGWVRVVLLADGYVPRVAGFGRYNGEPGWHPFDGALLHSATVSGRVTDNSGKPLADVAVQLVDIARDQESYQTAEEFATKTDAEGQFHFDNVPAASAHAHVHKDGYCLPGLPPLINSRGKEVVIKMSPAAELIVTVDFAGKERPKEYLVDIEPEGGNVVGSWGGSSAINQKNQTSFKDVPAGRYILQGHPNPYSDKELSKRIPIELKGGAHEEVKLTAKLDDSDDK